MTPKDRLIQKQKGYWEKREQAAKDAITDKTIEDINNQLLKYYKNAMKRVISEFEATYDKLLATTENGREPTPADLYKLDRYWQMQSQLANEMQKLGDYETALLSKEFEKQWKEIYETTAVPSDVAFATVPTDLAHTAIKTAWAPDGKNFSKRIWDNTEKLVQTLNEKLINCVLTGKKTSDLKKELVERFNVSLSQASTLVRTETAHIQVEAAAQRYKDSGIAYYKFLGRKEHDIGCECRKLDGKIFTFAEKQTGKNCPPMHPNCRCDIRAVVDIP